MLPFFALAAVASAAPHAPAAWAVSDALTLQTLVVRRGRSPLPWTSVDERHLATGELHSQEWRFARLPAGDGPLEVFVRPTSAFPPRRTGEGFSFGPLSWERFRWVDATGRAWPLEATWADGALVLTVPAHVLAASRFPAVLDPTIGPAASVGRLQQAQLGGPRHLDAAADGARFLLAFSQDRTDTTAGVYATRIEPDGRPVDPHGLLVARTTANASEVVVTPGNGVWLVVWVAETSGSRDVYAARLTPAGQVLDPGGVLLFNGPGDEGSLSLLFRGGTFELFWADDRNQSGSPQLFHASLSASLSVAPSATAALLDVGVSGLRDPAVTLDGAGYLVAWSDFSNGLAWQPKLARLSSTFAVLDPDGIPLSSTSNDAAHLAVRATPGGAWVAWDDESPSGPNRNVFAQLLTPGSAPVLAPALVADGTREVRKPRLVERPGPSFELFYLSSDRGSRSVLFEDGGATAPQQVIWNSYGADQVTVASMGTSLLSAMTASSIVYSWVESDAGTRQDFNTYGNSSNPQTGVHVAAGATQWLAAWKDRQDNRDFVRVSRVAADGALLDPAGIELTWQYYLFPPEVAVAGDVALVVWSDERTVNARRVAADGTVLDTQPLTLSSGVSRDPVVASNGTDFLVVFRDDRTSQYNHDLWATRVTRDGQVANRDGVLLVSRPGEQRAASLAYDGTRFVLAFTDSQSRDVRYGTIPSTGPLALTPSGGEPLGAATTARPSVGAGPNGALLAWEDDRNGGLDLFFHALPLGAAPSPAMGQVLTDAAGDQRNVSISSDGVDFFATWEDRSTDSDVFVARVTTAGTLREAPFKVAGAAPFERGPSIAGLRAGQALLGFDVIDETPPSTTRRVRLRTVGLPAPNGAACVATSDCSSGFCVDGVCCDTACGASAADCQACSAATGASADGVCTLLAATTVCRAAASVCDFTERCSGSATTCPDDSTLADGVGCGVGVCRAGQCEAGSSADGGVPDAAVFVSAPPTTGSCSLPWRYTPEVMSTAPARFTVRGVDSAPLPDELYVNPDTGAVIWRPSSAQQTSFELVATVGAVATVQRITVEVNCEPLRVGCSCSDVGGAVPGVVLLVGLALRRRRARQ